MSWKFVASQELFIVDAQTSKIDVPLRTGVHVEAGLYYFRVPNRSPYWASCNYDGCTHDSNGGHVLAHQSGISMHVGSLVARVGDQFFFVGTGPSYLEFETKGELEFIYWDSHYDDNSGSMIVIVEHIGDPAPNVHYADSVPMLIMKGVSNCEYNSNNIRDECFAYAFDERIKDILSLIDSVSHYNKPP